MGVLVACVNFQFTVHSTTQRALRQHAFNRDLNHTLRTASNHLFKGRLFDTTDVASVVIVDLVSTLVAGYSNFFCVQNDDVITRINVRSVFRFMLTRRRRASSVARRPKVLPVASTTYQSRWTVSGLAVKVFIEKLTQIKLHVGEIPNA